MYIRSCWQRELILAEEITFGANLMLSDMDI